MVEKDNQLTCEHVWREISNYLEGDVDAGLRAAMDTHFRTCQRCQSVLEGTRNVIRLYSDERLIEERAIDEKMIEVPAGYSRRLQKRLAQNARASRPRWSTWSAWLVPVAALALITGGLEVANSLTRTRPVQSPMAQFVHSIPPDMVVVVSTDAKLFHAPGCDFIHNKDKERTLTAKEAMQQGYAPCLRCMRKYLNAAAIGKGPLPPELDDHDVEAEEVRHAGGQ
jgi:hypothetical protein